MLRTSFVTVLLGLSLVACRGGDDGGGDDQPPTDTPPVITDATIQEIQNDAMPSGTEVSIKGVVVTAIDTYGNRTGDFFVQEPGGGEFSGVKVFGAALDQVAGLVPGDLVDITGAIKHEACNDAAPCGTVIFDNGASITEVIPVTSGSMIVTKVGTGTVPAPAEVDAAAISLLPTPAERDAVWEKWEGVLIKVTKLRQLEDVGTFGSNPGPDSTEFQATGFVRVQSALSELPTTSVLGVCYESITGVGDFFFNYILAPRSAADLVADGTACRPMATTVAMLQTGVNVEIASLSNVFVTARDDLGTTTDPASNRGFWVADSLTAAPNNGVYVFTRSEAVPANYEIGAIVNVQGGVVEFDLGSGGAAAVGDTLTEVVNPVHAFVSAPGNGPGGQPTPVVVTATVAGDIGAPGEPYEGVLVRVQNVKVTNLNAGSGKVELSDAGGAKIIMDNDAFNWTAPAAATCYATLTGIMSVQVNDNVRTINPRNIGDFVVAPNATACD